MYHLLRNDETTSAPSRWIVPHRREKVQVPVRFTSAGFPRDGVQDHGFVDEARHRGAEVPARQVAVLVAEKAPVREKAQPVAGARVHGPARKVRGRESRAGNNATALGTTTQEQSNTQRLERTTRRPEPQSDVRRTDPSLAFLSPAHPHPRIRPHPHASVPHPSVRPQSSPNKQK